MTQGGRTRWVRGLGCLLVPLLAVAAADVFLWGGWALGDRTVRVTGRLVDGAGEPRAGVRVLTLPSEKWRDDPKRIAFSREEIEARDKWIAEGHEAEPLLYVAGGTTDGEGAFDLRLLITHCTRMGVLLPLLDDEDTPPFAGVRCLLVDLPGGPVSIDCTKGTWTEHGEGKDPFATLDLGTVRVP